MSSRDITIEFAQATDAEEIAALSHQYIEHGLRWAYTPRRVKALLKNSSKNVIVALDDGQLVGFGIMTYREQHANLDLLAVKTRFRRRGIGDRLVQWLEDVATTAGISDIFVQVRRSNASALHFYKLLNFKEIDEQTGYYQGVESAVILCKSIRPAFSPR